MANIESLRFTKTHEWMALQGTDGVVGMTQRAQEETSDVVFVELPKLNKTLQAGQEAAVIESVKAAFSIYAPVAGTVVRVNDRLAKEPALLNAAPYDDGWMFALTLTNPRDAEGLMSYAQYQAWITEEKQSGGVHA